MTPVGILLILLGIGAAYLVATRAPSLLAAGIAIIIAIILRALCVRADNELQKMAEVPNRDPWAATPRKERRLLARALKLSISSTTLTSLFPQQALQGYRIAGRMGFA